MRITLRREQQTHEPTQQSGITSQTKFYRFLINAGPYSLSTCGRVTADRWAQAAQAAGRAQLNAASPKLAFLGGPVAASAGQDEVSSFYERHELRTSRHLKSGSNA
jgi:hypothetical protein